MKVKIFDPLLSKFASLNIWLLTLRVAVSALMLTHGIPKFLNLISGDIQFGDPFGIGPMATLILVVFAEIICSILLILGLKTRLASIPLIINMAVSAFYIHGSDPIGKKELALLYLLIYGTIFVFGGGKYSIDKLIWKRSIKSRYR